MSTSSSHPLQSKFVEHNVVLVVFRKEALRESNFKEDTRDVKTKKLARRKKEAENSAPMSLVMIEGDEVSHDSDRQYPHQTNQLEEL